MDVNVGFAEEWHYKNGDLCPYCSHATETLIASKAVSVSAKSGSTVITISADTLEKLSKGTHTVTVKFDDGQVETTLTISEAPSPTPPEPTPPDVPKTGVNNHLSLYAMFMISSLISLLTIFRCKKKKAN